MPGRIDIKRFSYAVPVLLLLLSAGCGRGSGSTTLDQLKERIGSRLGALEGDFALAFRNLSDTSQYIALNEREMFHAASTMKTPVMIEVFRQAERGRFGLDDSILVRNQFRSIVDSSLYRMEIGEDSEEKLYGLVGRKRTVRDLVDDMITASSNLATNLLVEKVGAQNVTQTMRSYGADSIRVLRGVQDIKAYERGLSNRTTAHDERLIYEQLATGGAVSRQASDEMIEILLQQQLNEMIPARLPEEVKVAHKTGWITGVHHDCGIVLLPDGDRYVLVMLSKNAPDREEVIAAFAGISRTIYDFVERQP